MAENDSREVVDVNEEVEEKFNYLFRSLPDKLQTLAEELRGVCSFLQKIKVRLDNEEEESEKSESSSNADSIDKADEPVRWKDKKFTSLNSRRSQISRLKVIPGLKVPKYAREYREKCVTEEGIRLCCYCLRPGHFVFTCYQLAREQGIVINGVRREKSAPSPVIPEEVTDQDN